MNREQVLAHQIGMLNSVVNVAGGFLTAFDGERHHERTLDENIKQSAEATLMGAFARMDKIIEDDANWSMIELREERRLNAEAIRNIGLEAKIKAEVLKRENRPSHQHNAVVARLESGEYIAFTGDLRDSKTVIAAIGASPEEALQGWDLIYLGRVPMENLDFLKIINELLPEKKPRKKKP